MGRVAILAVFIALVAWVFLVIGVVRLIVPRWRKGWWKWIVFAPVFFIAAVAIGASSTGNNKTSPPIASAKSHKFNGTAHFTSGSFAYTVSDIKVDPDNGGSTREETVTINVSAKNTSTSPDNLDDTMFKLISGPYTYAADQDISSTWFIDQNVNPGITSTNTESFTLPDKVKRFSLKVNKSSSLFDTGSVTIPLY